jgi:hypothetical protein
VNEIAKVPEAQNDFFEERAFAAGMKTNPLLAICIGKICGLFYILLQNHVILSTNRSKASKIPHIDPQNPPSKQAQKKAPTFLPGLCVINQNV